VTWWLISQYSRARWCSLCCLRSSSSCCRL